MVKRTALWCTLLLVGCATACSQGPKEITKNTDDADIKIDGVIFNQCIPMAPANGRRLRIGGMTLENLTGKTIELLGVDALNPQNAALASAEVVVTENRFLALGTTWEKPLTADYQQVGKPVPLAGFTLRQQPEMVSPLLHLQVGDFTKPVKVEKLAFTYKVDGQERRQVVDHGIEAVPGPKCPTPDDEKKP